MNYKKGDLLTAFQQGEIDILVHGCNCFHTMGAGIAKDIKRLYPKAYAADLQTLKGSPAKLGTYSLARIGDQYILNAYTQYRYGGIRDANYSAIQRVMNRVKLDLGHLRIGIPKIGAGRARGDWAIIEQMIDAENFSDLTCYIL